MVRRRRPRARFWFETVLAIAAAALAVLTWIDPEWIETLFGVEPDAGNGVAEVAIVLAFALTAAISSGLARRDWLRRPLVAGADA